MTGAWSKTTASQFAIQNGATLTVGGDSTWTQGELCLTTGATLRIAASLDVAAGAGTFNCSSGDSVVDIEPAGDIAVAGGSHTWNSRVENDGTINMDGGSVTLSADGAGTDDGDILIDTGATLTNATSRSFSGTARIGGAGTFTNSGGASTMANNAILDPGTLTLSGGTLNLDGTTPATTLPQVNITGGTFSGTRNRSITNLATSSGALTGAHTSTVTGAWSKTTRRPVRHPRPARRSRPRAT